MANAMVVICYPMSVIDSLSPTSFSSTDTRQGDYVRVYPTHDPVKAKLYTLLLQSSSRISLPGTYVHTLHVAMATNTPRLWVILVCFLLREVWYRSSERISQHHRAQNEGIIVTRTLYLV